MLYGIIVGLALLVGVCLGQWSVTRWFKKKTGKCLYDVGHQLNRGEPVKP